MTAMIASSAIQLTFGLPKINLKHFERILIYPDEYYSTINKQYHKGEVNPRLKAIVVSWKAFVAGYADPHDGINLGLHEMAHALKLENIIKNGELWLYTLFYAFISLRFFIFYSVSLYGCYNKYYLYFINSTCN